MSRPIQVNLPHKLGRDEARRRIGDNIHKLQDHMPGGAAHVESGWVGDTLNLKIGAMGQNVDAEVTVEDAVVRCKVLLPGILALFAAPFEAMLTAKGTEFLEDHSKDGDKG